MSIRYVWPCLAITMLHCVYVSAANPPFIKLLEDFEAGKTPSEATQESYRKVHCNNLDVKLQFIADIEIMLKHSSALAKPGTKAKFELAEVVLLPDGSKQRRVLGYEQWVVKSRTDYNFTVQLELSSSGIVSRIFTPNDYKPEVVLDPQRPLSCVLFDVMFAELIRSEVLIAKHRLSTLHYSVQNTGDSVTYAEVPFARTYWSETNVRDGQIITTEHRLVSFSW